MEYEKIIEAIEGAPRTYLGGILVKVVEIAIKKNFFADGAALKRVVSNVVLRYSK